MPEVKVDLLQVDCYVIVMAVPEDGIEIGIRISEFRIEDAVQVRAPSDRSGNWVRDEKVCVVRGSDSSCSCWWYKKGDVESTTTACGYNSLQPMCYECKSESVEQGRIISSFWPSA